MPSDRPDHGHWDTLAICEGKWQIRCTSWSHASSYSYCRLSELPPSNDFDLSLNYRLRCVFTTGYLYTNWLCDPLVFPPISRCTATGWRPPTVCPCPNGIRRLTRNGRSTIRRCSRGSSTCWRRSPHLSTSTCWWYTITTIRQTPRYFSNDLVSSSQTLCSIMDLKSWYYSYENKTMCSWP